MSTSPSISPEQLIALNDEIVALTHAGVPLERGLKALGRHDAGEIGRLADELSARLARGESLAQWIQSGDSGYPPLYRAALAAGLRSGRLPAVLDSLGSTTRRIVELQGAVRKSFFYPLVVVCTAYVLFLFALINVTPGIQTAYDSFDVPRTWTLRALTAMESTVTYWWAIPLVFLGLFLIWEFITARRAVYGDNHLWSSPYYALQRDMRLAVFCDVLALLVEQQVPLGEAVALAAGASGSARLKELGEQFEDCYRRGAISPANGFPPLLAYILSSSQEQADLVRALRRIAENYERRARRTTDWLTLYFPMLITTVIGGSAAVLQIFSFIRPWADLLHQFSLP